MTDEPPCAPFELRPVPEVAPAPPPIVSGYVSPLPPPVAPSAASDLQAPLRATLLPVRIRPIGGPLTGVSLWFELMKATATGKGGEGLTARQLARALAEENLASAFESILDAMATSGDVLRRGSRTPRYASRPLDKALVTHLRAAREAGPGGAEWEAFELAVMAYEDDPRQWAWTRLREAFGELVASFPAWPTEVIREAQANADRWLSRLAEVAPPPHLAEGDEIAAVRAENRTLQAEVEALRERLKARPAPVVGEGGKKAELRQRVEALELENASYLERLQALAAEVEELEAELGDTAEPGNVAVLDAFLAGAGHAPLPASVTPDEAARLRAMILDTRATRDVQRALVAKLAAIHLAPHRFQRLTSRSFTETPHPFETLHRARVGGYRIGYGLARKAPKVIALGTRENFYGGFLARLREATWH